ncbi:rhodanese domain-containing protein CG4456 isoform X1 [Nasonia vitripennis]|uniref:Rhodanese domain-containing protein n=1 Tax=Nasonia vitripennis TaxID=7425 RepID=A0A7M7HA00_NASVI|nr:rhodanese domain-containing protein CG4456 isoform X1 [Nasonia vitripennis]
MTSMITTFPSKLRQLHRLSCMTKCLNDKRFYTSEESNCFSHHSKHITSVGRCRIMITSWNKQLFLFILSGCFSHPVTTNYTNILSRAMSGQGDNLKVNYDELLKAQKDESILIIDVREDSEIQETGKLPGSIHIPMGEVTNVLTNTTSHEFEQKFSKKKPDKDTKIILSCRSGRRSASVQSEIQKLGYNNAYNYEGGWLDWESKQAA